MKKPSKKQTILVVALIIALLVLGGVLFAYQQNTKDGSEVATNNTGIKEGDINYGPPTEQEKKETEKYKQELNQKLSENKPVATSSNSVKAVSPQISTLAKQNNSVFVSGFIPSIGEDGGTCNLIIQNGSKKITKTNKSIADVSSTSCQTYTIDIAELGKGTWSFTLDYVSQYSKGTSEQRKLDI